MEVADFLKVIICITSVVIVYAVTTIYININKKKIKKNIFEETEKLKKDCEKELKDKKRNRN